MPSSLTLIAVLLTFVTTLSSQAREWVSSEGKKIEAEFVELIGDTVHIKKGAKLFKVPLDKLSADDQQYAKDRHAELEKKAEAARTGPIKFAGQALQRGKVNRITLDLSSENQKIAKEGGRGWGDKYAKSTPNAWEKAMHVGYSATQADVFIGVPAKFDPTLATQPIFVQWTTTNIKSNINGANAYWANCNQNNVLLISVDAKPNDAAAWAAPVFYANIKEIFEQLHQTWPASKQWPVMVGGFSGGSKISQWMGPLIAQLPDVHTVGLWLGGCNEAHLFDYGFSDLKVKKSTVRGLKIFISSGSSDPYVNANHRQKVEAGCKSAGAKQIRAEVYNGAHVIHQPHLTEAFQWFLEENDSRR